MHVYRVLSLPAFLHHLVLQVREIRVLFCGEYDHLNKK